MSEITIKMDPALASITEDGLRQAAQKVLALSAKTADDKWISGMYERQAECYIKAADAIFNARVRASEF